MNAVSLAELQRWVRWAITGEARGEREPAPALGALIEEAGPHSRARRIRAYSEAFRVRLAEALAIDYPGILAALGEDEFRVLTQDYVVAHPSRSPNLAAFGAHLPSFLRASERAPFLGDLAELEWQIARSYYAEDVPLLDLGPLTGASPEAWAAARFELDPSVSWLETQWPVLRLHRLADSGRPVADALPHRPRIERILIFRDLQGNTQVRRAGAAELSVLKGMRAGATLGEIATHLQENEGAASAPKLQTWFQDWVTLGLIRKVIAS